MVGDRFSLHHHWSLRFGISDELSRDYPTLMHQLVKTVLTICSWLAKNDWSCVNSLGISDSMSSHSFTIALHVTLLDVGWESQKSLAVWENGTRSVSTNMRVVETQKTHQNGGILCEVSFLTKVFIDRMHSIEESLHVIEAIVQ